MGGGETYHLDITANLKTYNAGIIFCDQVDPNLCRGQQHWPWDQERGGAKFNQNKM